MKENGSPMKKDKTTKMAKIETLDLLGIVGLIYFIVIVLGIIEFIPRPEITLWIFAPIFWVRERSETACQTD